MHRRRCGETPDEEMEEIAVKFVPIPLLPQEWWSEQHWKAEHHSPIWDRCLDALQHQGPSSDKTPLQPYSTGNTISLQITFPPSFSLSGSYLILCPSLFFLFKCVWQRARRGEKKKHDINITRVLIMQWERQHWERSGETGGAEGRKTGHFPLVWLRQRRSESSCGAPQC